MEEQLKHCQKNLFDHISSWNGFRLLCALFKWKSEHKADSDGSLRLKYDKVLESKLVFAFVVSPYGRRITHI